VAGKATLEELAALANLAPLSPELRAKAAVKRK